MSKNYSKLNIGTFSNVKEKGRIMIGKDLDLTGCEVSVNSLPAHQSIPFVHAHTENEEVYVVLQGEGTFMIDSDEFLIKEGEFIRVSKEAPRVLKANNQELVYLCIQTKQDSLNQATENDGVMIETKASWM